MKNLKEYQVPKMSIMQLNMENLMGITVSLTDLKAEDSPWGDGESTTEEYITPTSIGSNPKESLFSY